LREAAEGREGGQGGEGFIDLLTILVSTPSPSHQEAAAVRVLVDWMSAHGLKSHIDAAGNAVGVAGTGDKTLVMLGHIDTFGGMLPVRREGDILHGRGTVDAKGPLCAFASAASSARIPDGWRVVVIGAVEEECPTSAGAHYAVTQYTPQMCIIGEPSRWDRLTLGYKGRLICDWEIRADLAHSANPTASPAELAFAAWQAVQAYAVGLNEGRAKAFEQLLVTLHAVNTGDDGVHGWARMSIGFRLPPDVSLEGLEGEIRALLAPLTPNPSPTRGERLHFTSHTPTYAGPRDTDLSRLFRAAIRTEGGTPAFVYKTGTSDMNIAGPTWGCPILAYGAGDSSLDHTPHEHIDLTEYLRSIRVLTGVVESLA
jgi:LysW-gamma-L-lysine carboxypeptidase